MAHVLVRHRVKNYPAWKTVFDGAIKMRKTSGEKSYQILQPESDPNDLILLFEWDSLLNAKKFLESPELRAAMKQSGVIDEPEVHFLKEAGRGRV